MALISLAGVLILLKSDTILSEIGGGIAAGHAAYMHFYDVLGLYI
jgi:hypothetical protein